MRLLLRFGASGALRIDRFGELALDFGEDIFGRRDARGLHPLDQFVPFQPASIANADGSALIQTGETDLTILGELNKLAANISEGRDMSGIHWRVSDNMLGMLLGEDVAIYLLNETAALYPEQFKGFTLTKFDGTTILVGGN